MRRSNVLFFVALLAVATTIGVFLAWTLAGWPHSVALDDLGETVAAWAGALACARAALRHRGRGRAAWALMAGSAMLWGAGEAVWSWYELAAGTQVPFPSLADAGFLGAVPLAAAGALLFPGLRRTGRARFASVIDGLVIACGLLAVSWVTVLHAVYAAGGDTALAEVLSIAYPVGDIVIATMLTNLVLRLPRANRLPVLLLVAGLAANALSDSSFAYLTAQGTYGSGNALDTGWVAGYLLLALGALRAAQRPRVTQPDESTASWWRLVAPYIPMAAAIAAAAREVSSGQTLEPFVFWLVVTLVGLVIVRQFLTLSDNHALLHQLGTREAEMRHRAFHDPLTNLPNRALFAHGVEAALDRGNVGAAPLVAAMVIDLDDFKDVNDTLGHDAGDRLLVEVGARLLASVRPTDTVARLGGDEFAVLLEPMPHRQRAEAIAARVVANLHHSVEMGHLRVPVQASVGVALVRAGEVGREELLRRADVAMYQAKGGGKGRWVTYDGAMEPDVSLGVAQTA